MKKFLIGVALIALAAPASAAVTFVGSWSVYDSRAPYWGSGTAPAYSAIEAAALLFGGSASDYSISTLGPDTSTIDHQAWYDGYAIGGGILAEDYKNGDFYTYGVRSAFIRDNYVFGTNYAFRVSDVPEPASWALMLGGFGLIGGVMRSNRRSVKISFA